MDIKLKKAMLWEVECADLNGNRRVTWVAVPHIEQAIGLGFRAVADEVRILNAKGYDAKWPHRVVSVNLKGEITLSVEGTLSQESEG